jgi:hypothetical protein
MLTAESVKAAPAGLAQSLSAAPAASSSAAAGIAKGAVITMAAKKTAVAGAAVLALLVAGGGVTMLVRSMMASPAAGGRTVRVALPSSPPQTTGRGAVTFPDGTTVQIVGMNELPPASAVGKLASLVGVNTRPPQESPKWWGADGAPVTGVRLDPNQIIYVGDTPGRRQVRFIFSTRGPGASGSGFTFQIDGAGAQAMSSRSLPGGERQTNYVVSLPADQARTRVRIGMATGPWRQDESVPVPATQSTAVPAGGSAAVPAVAAATPAGTPAATRPRGPAIFGAVSEVNGRCTVAVNGNAIPGGRDGHMVAVLANGKRVHMSEYRGDGDGRGVATFNCKRDQVVRLVHESRPYEWAEMGDVALQPDAAAATTRPAQTTARP